MVACRSTAFINFSVAVVIDSVTAFFRFWIVVACSDTAVIFNSVAVVVDAVAADLRNRNTLFGAAFVNLEVAVIIDSVADLGRRLADCDSFFSAGDDD